jgi:hypothetical protein
MNREPNAPFELCRAELTAPVRLSRLAEDWRRDLNTLEAHRIRRDRDAMQRIEAALTGSGDWFGFASAVQAATHDYANESLAIWGEAISLTAQHQGEWLAELDSVFGAWRTLWHAPLQKLPGIEPAVGSFSGWMRTWQDAMPHVGVWPKHDRASTADAQAVPDTAKGG